MTSLTTSDIEECTRKGHLRPEIWQSILPALLSQINHIAHNDFPIPKPFPIVDPEVLQARRFDSEGYLNELTPGHNQQIDIEASPNPPQTPPNTATSRQLPPVPAFSDSGRENDRIPETQSDSQQENQNDTPPSTQVLQPPLPIELTHILNDILSHLQSRFHTSPPHTIQRLCELILTPTRHYKTLPAWLRALDRVSIVSAYASDFPLSDTPPFGASRVNGVNASNGNGGINDPSEVGGILRANVHGDIREDRNEYSAENLGSDESLGGALLTPIPWLKNLDNENSPTTVLATRMLDEEMLIDPTVIPDTNSDADDIDAAEMSIREAEKEHMADLASDAAAIADIVRQRQEDGDVPSREGGAVTEGELIRMEQEAGVVPVPHDTDVELIDEDFGSSGLEGQAEDVPHARGPDVLGTVDMGLVDGQKKEVSITHGSSEAKTRNVNVNDAQDVLVGGVKGENRSEQAEQGTEETERERPVDTRGGEGMKALPEETAQEDEDEDEDIVFVDADGGTASDSKDDDAKIA